MRQVDTMRRRLADRGAWFRVGLASATIATPLISRWNDLRAGERVREFADEAEERIRELGTWVPWSRRKRLEREAVEMVREVTERATNRRGGTSSVIWLVGVGIGLVAAGTGAYVLVRRRLDAETEQPLIAVVTAPHNGNGHANEPSNEPRTSAAGSARPVADASTDVPAPGALDATQPATTVSRSSEADGIMAVAEESEGAADLAGDTTQQEQFIGNIRTMVYHDADAEGLPTEENRIYFASEEEARQAGFRRDRDEVVPSAESGTPSQNSGSGGH